MRMAVLAFLVFACAPVFAQALPLSIVSTAQATYVLGAHSVSTRSNTTIVSVLQAGASLSQTPASTTTLAGSSVSLTLKAFNTGTSSLGDDPTLLIDGRPDSSPDVVVDLPAGLSLAQVPSSTAPFAYHFSGTPSSQFVSSATAQTSLASGQTVDEVLYSEPGLATPGASVLISLTLSTSKTFAPGQVFPVNSILRYGIAGVLPPSFPQASSNIIIAPTSSGLSNYMTQSHGYPENYGLVGAVNNLVVSQPGCSGTQLATLSTNQGDLESVTVHEVSPGSGIFDFPPLPIERGSAVPHDGVIESQGNSTLTVSIPACGPSASYQLSLIDPSGIVFDSATNAPVSGASVSLVKAQGGSCTAQLASVQSTDSQGNLVSSANPVTTDSQGLYDFPLVAAGSYCLLVTAPSEYTFPSKIPVSQLPSSRAVQPQASYGLPFTISSALGYVSADIPLDSSQTASQLSLTKTASTSTATMGQQVEFTLTLQNNGSSPTQAGFIDDRMPAGMAYVSGSTQVNGQASSNPTEVSSQELHFAFPSMGHNATETLTYRVVILPGTSGQNLRNTAVAQAGNIESSQAEASVLIEDNLLGNSGYVVGTAYLDCDPSHAGKTSADPGVPNVRLYLEDGTYVRTDRYGEFSFYGVTPQTHVLKPDSFTFPRGATLEGQSTRFVDVYAGQMVQQNLAFTCTPQARKAVEARVKAMAPALDPEMRLAQRELSTTESGSPQKSAIASGLIEQTSSAAVATSRPVVASSQVASTNSLPSPSEGSKGSQDFNPAGVAKLEELIKTFTNNHSAIVYPVDGARVAADQTLVRIKGPKDSVFTLFVNGKPVPATRIGKTSILKAKELLAREYIGVPLLPGKNTLELREVDQFGNQRADLRESVYAPGALKRIRIAPLSSHLVAKDGSVIGVRIELMDAHGMRLKERIPVTLTAKGSTWAEKDLDNNVPGTQVVLPLSGIVHLNAPKNAQTVHIKISAGNIHASQDLVFSPNLRPLIADGIADFTLRFNGLSGSSIQPASSTDAFQQELRSFAHFGGSSLGARTAFFLKGKVKGSYLLTLAYDSNKTSQQMLFRDIQPDQYYPIYGDGSARGFDAQSTSRLYVRVQGKHSWILYGDLETSTQSGPPTLSTYQRVLTGLQGHIEKGPIQASAFVAQSSTLQKVDEFPAEGISGPYTLSNPDLVPGSEQVSIIVRQRGAPSVIVSQTVLTRNVDYSIEPLTGTLLLNNPVPTLDAQGNPEYIRVTYEVYESAAASWVGGGHVEYKVTKNLAVGANLAKDNNPSNPYFLGGAYAALQVGKHASVMLDEAHSRTGSGLNAQSGNAQRIKAHAQVSGTTFSMTDTRTDTLFNNPSAGIGPGQRSLDLEASRPIDSKTTGNLKVSSASDTLAGTSSSYALVGANRQVSNNLQLGVYARHSTAVFNPYTQSTSSGSQSASVNSVGLRAQEQIPQVKGLSVEGRYEQAVSNSSGKWLQVGADYHLTPSTKVYGRYSVLSSLDTVSPVASNGQTQQNITAFGIQSNYSAHGSAYSEYRVRDALSGGDTEAALGLREQYSLLPGLRWEGTFERVNVLSGQNATDQAVAVTSRFDLDTRNTRNVLRLEARSSSTSHTYLVMAGTGVRVSPDVTLLVRSAYNNSIPLGQGQMTSTGRFQAGIAYRNRNDANWNLISTLEDRRDNTGTSIEDAKIFSNNLAWAPAQAWQFQGRVSFGRDNLNSGGLDTLSTVGILGEHLTYQFSPKWDAGIAAQQMHEYSHTDKALGVELGYHITGDVWISAGYRIYGYNPNPLFSSQDTRQGFYLRLRIKADEGFISRWLNLGTTSN